MNFLWDFLSTQKRLKNGKYCNHLCLRSICPENFAASYPALIPSNASLLSQLVRGWGWMASIKNSWWKRLSGNNEIAGQIVGLDGNNKIAGQLLMSFTRNWPSLLQPAGRWSFLNPKTPEHGWDCDNAVFLHIIK